MKPGILIISHGSRDDAWVRNVEEAVSGLSLREEVPVAVSFLELVEGRLIQDGIDMLEHAGVTDILVIPLFVSSGSTHVDEIEYALGAKPEPERETDLELFNVKARVHYGYPVDDDPDIALMLWDKIRGCSTEPSREVLLLVGHGSVHDGFRQRWQAGISSLAARVREVSGTRSSNEGIAGEPAGEVIKAEGVALADYALLNPDSLRSKVEYWGGQGYTVLLAPLFLSEGYFTKVVIPKKLQGLDYRYSGETLLPHPLLRHWVETQAGLLLEKVRREVEIDPGNR
ncbi:sirohydrochlorin chelatase [Paenibacillus sp. sgz500958]|uniref:sirohydrochlorin chelatase n=1 Tax=Paenibacillus sp. sgz500958 TaxID=3242475 RepID=UPI0036D2F016